MYKQNAEKKITHMRIKKKILILPLKENKRNMLKLIIVFNIYYFL